MSSLSKSILCLVLYPYTAKKTLERTITKTHEKFQEYVTMFETPQQEYVGFYVFVYLEDQENLFRTNTVTVITEMLKEGFKPILSRILEKEGFTRHEWKVILDEETVLHEVPKYNIPYQFVFIQIAFVTKAWLSLIREQIQDYAAQHPTIYPLKKWNNYLSSVLFLIPTTENCREVTSKHIQSIVENIIKASEHVKLEQPKKHAPEILYQDISTTIVSSLIHSTTQGLAIKDNELVPFAIHLDNDTIILRIIKNKEE